MLWRNAVGVFALLVSSPIKAYTEPVAASQEVPTAARAISVTSDYIDFHFDGLVEVRETASHCLYRFGPFSVTFNERDAGKVTWSATILALRIIAVHQDGQGQRTQLFEDRKPLVLMFDRPGQQFSLDGFEILVPKAIAAEATYIGMSLTGRSRGHVHDPVMQAMAGPSVDRAVSWPMAFTANIESYRQRHGPDGVYQDPVWLRPADPHDACAPERLR